MCKEIREREKIVLSLSRWRRRERRRQKTSEKKSGEPLWLKESIKLKLYKLALNLEEKRRKKLNLEEASETP